MTQMNRGEAIRCIQIAKKCIKQNNLKKAEKFLNKSLRMYETVEAKQLLESLQTPTPTQPSSSNTNCPPNTNTPPTATQSMPNLNRTTAGNSSTSSLGGRMSKDEEVAMIRKILRAKDFYKILGVSKDADEKELKKAYRKLALKCHPDRNQAPGAEEAFKKLSKAYDCLRDQRKRQIYDQYGEDSPQMRHNSHGAQFQQMTPDDIIRMFFGGDFGPRQGGFHFHTGFPGQQQRRRRADGDAQQVEQGPMVYIMQLLPIILVFFTMILPSLMMFGGSGSGSNNAGRSGGLFGGSNSGLENVYFSLDKTHPFTLQKKTAMDTIYYVQHQRRGTWAYQRQKPRRLEQEVESAYLGRLIQECDKQTNKDNDRINDMKSNKMSHKQRKKKLKSLMKNKTKLKANDNKQCTKLFQYVDEL
eukprot:209335_1